MPFNSTDRQQSSNVSSLHQATVKSTPGSCHTPVHGGLRSSCRIRAPHICSSYRPVILNTKDRRSMSRAPSAETLPWHSAGATSSGAVSEIAHARTQPNPAPGCPSTSHIGNTLHGCCNATCLPMGHSTKLHIMAHAHATRSPQSL